MPSGLTSNLAKIVAQKIVEGTKDSKKTPTENWEFIVNSIFEAFKNESIIVVDQLENITIKQGLFTTSPGAPISPLSPTATPLGTISAPSSVNLKGKIT